MAYGFNGIERVDPAGFELGVNMAFYRTLDPALGQWWSVDPMTDVLPNMSPYCAMFSADGRNAISISSDKLHLLKYTF